MIHIKIQCTKRHTVAKDKRQKTEDKQINKGTGKNPKIQTEKCQRDKQKKTNTDTNSQKSKQTNKH